MYPSFWTIIKKDFNKNKINDQLKCPMNYLYNLDLSDFRNPDSTLPMSYFFIKHEMNNNIRTCKKVEDLLVKYSIKLYQHNLDKDNETYLLLRKDFDDLIADINKIKISKNYLGLFSWLIDRAFLITPSLKSTRKQLISTINKNKSILIKVLYDMNPDSLLKCFSKNS